ncbi:MAG: pterin-4-alpha-carbinolamine dehydratase [Acidobacteria bacterium]|nr:pterin-4-alpha-carbinolamine dehydratase [Acidobacteriota bacterium]
MKVLSQSEIKQKLSALKGWALAPEGIQKSFKLKDFRTAITFVGQVADLAEEAFHHPDILIQYDRVTFTLTTHDAGGITQKDFSLAADIEAIAPGGN